METDPPHQPGDRFRPSRVALTGGAASGVAVAAFSGDSACAALGAAFIAAAICGAAAYGVRWAARKRRRWMALALLIVALAAAQVLWTRATLRREVFRAAFGAAPPTAIRDLRVARHYAGGPGDTVALLRFSADADTVAALVAGLVAASDTILLEEVDAGRVRAGELWKRSFSLGDSFPHDWWPKEAPPLADPLWYEQPMNSTGQSATVLWDRGTGEVFVMVMVG